MLRPRRVIFTAALKQMELIAAQPGEAESKSAVHFGRWLDDDKKRGVNESNRAWERLPAAGRGLKVL